MEILERGGFVHPRLRAVNMNEDLFISGEGIWIAYGSECEGVEVYAK